MPGVKVTKGPAADARMRVEMRREFFNVMAKEGKVPDWVEAFTYGQAKATGPEQFLKLIANVVERQQERERTRKARKHALTGGSGSLSGRRVSCWARNASEPSRNRHITIREKFSFMALCDLLRIGGASAVGAAEFAQASTRRRRTA